MPLWYAELNFILVLGINLIGLVNLNNASADSETSQTTGPGDDSTLVFNEVCYCAVI